MARNDLQISSTWTDPDLRGKGLAKSALRKAVKLMQQPGRRFWYVTLESNSASVAVCENANFSLVGHARRVSFLGIRLLGRLIMEE